MKKIIFIDKGVVVTKTNIGTVIKKVKGLNMSGPYPKCIPTISVNREIKALNIIKDMNNVQKLYRKVSKTELETIYVSGIMLDKYGKISIDCYEKIEKTLLEAYERGIYRIKSRKFPEKDIIISDNEEPIIIDFGNVIFKDDLISKIPGFWKYLGILLKKKLKKIKEKYVQ